LRLHLLAILLLLGACPKDKCPAGFIGDPAQPPQAVMIWTDGVSQQIADVTPNQALPLEPPPQGGYVMYLAARILNMDACVDFSGKLKDPDTGHLAGMDARGSTLTKRDDGWGVPDPGSNANFSNVNGCPDYDPKDVQGKPYTLEMTVVDKHLRKAVATQTIVPTCMLSDAPTQADCICNCSANYTLGKCGDAGARD